MTDLPYGDPTSLRTVAGSRLFKSLDEQGLARLLGGATAVTYRPGQVVVREGDAGEALYLIQEGRVRVYTTTDGQEIDLAMLGPGACCGEVALLSGRPRTATVVAEERCRVLCFHKQQIDEILRDYPQVREILQAVVYHRARDTMEKIAALPRSNDDET